MKSKKITGEKLRQIFMTIVVITMLAMVFLIIFGNYVYGRNRDILMGGAHYEEFSDGWKQVLPDGNKISVKLPNNLKAENGTVILEKKLPDKIDMGTFIGFRGARQEITVYIGNEKRFEYNISNRLLSGGDTPGAIVMMPIHASDNGKTIRIKTVGDSIYSGFVSSVYIGDRAGVYRYYVLRYEAELVLATVLFIISVTIIIITKINDKRMNIKSEITYLAWGMALLSSWCITDGHLRQLVFNRMDVVSFASFIFLPLFPIPLMIYMDILQERRYSKGYNILSVALIITTAVETVLHLLHRVSFMQALPVTIFFMISVAIYGCAALVIDAVKGRTAKYRYIAGGVALFILFCILEIVMGINANTSLDKSMLIIGALLCSFSALWNEVIKVYKARTERQDALNLAAAKTSFLASMSHEIRTPINTVLGFNELIQRECKDEKITEYSNSIDDAGRILLSLINDILDFSKIEAGKLEIEEADYQTMSLVNDCMILLSEMAREKNQDIKLDMDKDVPSMLAGDDVRIKQIIINLLTNAVKYTNEGSVTLSVTGNKRENPIPGWDGQSDKNYDLIISVSDTGIGIKEENFPVLFDGFERLDKTRNRHIEGTGLGLAITKVLADNMKGRIDVESTYGVGSTFTVVIPQKIISDEPVGENASSSRYSNELKRKKYIASFKAPDVRILVVDDNKMNLKVFKGLLKSTEVQIDTAESGNIAISLTEKNIYDLIFMDHMMPEMDGVEAFKAIRSDKLGMNNNTPVVALTANAIQGIDKVYIDEGFTAYLSKPIVSDKLEKMIRDILNIEEKN